MCVCVCVCVYRERQTDREREREKQRDIERQRQRDRETKTETERGVSFANTDAIHSFVVGRFPHDCGVDSGDATEIRVSSHCNIHLFRLILVGREDGDKHRLYRLRADTFCKPPHLDFCRSVPAGSSVRANFISSGNAVVPLWRSVVMDERAWRQGVAVPCVPCLPGFLCPSSLAQHRLTDACKHARSRMRAYRCSLSYIHA